MSENWKAYLARRALKLMHQRTKQTIKTRAAFKKFKAFKRNLWLKMVFEALAKRNDDNKNLSVKLANIAAKFDNRMKE